MKAWSSLVNGDWVVTSGSLWGMRVGSGVHLFSQQSSQQWSATITNLLTYHHTLSTAMNLKKNQIPKLFLSKLIWHPSPKSHKTSQFQKKVKTTVDLIVEIGNCTMHVLMLNVKKRFEIMSKVRKLYKIFLLSRYILKKIVYHLWQEARGNSSFLPSPSLLSIPCPPIHPLIPV